MQNNNQDSLTTLTQHSSSSSTTQSTSSPQDSACGLHFPVNSSLENWKKDFLISTINNTARPKNSISMKRYIPKSPASACQLHDIIFSRLSPSLHRPFQRNLSLTRPSAAWPKQEKLRKLVKPTKPVTVKTSNSPREDQDNTNPSSNKHPTQYSHSKSKLDTNVREVAAQRDALLLPGKVPTEAEIMTALTYCDVVVDSLVEPTAAGDVKGATSASNVLLSLDEQNSKISTKMSQAFPPFALLAFDQLSQIAYSIISDHSIYVTPAILRLYVKIQAKLGNPKSFPEVFHLYAHKPIPLQDTVPIQYKKQRPNSITSAIENETAEIALQSAIDVRQLNVAIDIIENTYATTAYQRAKFVRRALIPVATIAVAPVAAYILASQLANFQDMMDPEVATKGVFVGIISYVGFTTMVGFIAVTTANDQMDRVTWAPGVPLRERWLREEERAAFDKIAGAWGFRESWRRGEEEGEEWEALRECIGRQGMILDRLELMEGME